MRSFASFAGSLAAFLLLAPALASAEEPAERPPDLPPPPPPPPYSIPWQLRGVGAATSIRSDTTMALYEDTASRHGATVASLLTGTVRVPHTGPRTAGLVLLLRGALAQDYTPEGHRGFVVGNPLIGGAYAFVLSDELRATIAFVATIPVGMGGGDHPDPHRLQARQDAAPARSQIDGAIFAANDVFYGPGVDLAWVALGVTLQAEANFFQFNRVRGALSEPEASKSSAIFGFHAGYYLLPTLSAGAELRYQHWLNAPFAVENDVTRDSWDTLTFAIGPRVHLPLSRRVGIHPGLAYVRGLDKPMAGAAPNYHIIQLDIPVVF